MSSVFSKDELLIGKIKALATDTEAKTLLDAYEPTKSMQHNVDFLGGSSSILQKHLLSAVKLLQSMDNLYPALATRISAIKSSNRTTKMAAATAIVRFIKDARDITCNKCKEDYCPYSIANASSSEVTCFMCCRPGHEGCYTDSQLDEEAGVVYLCSECLLGKIPLPPIHQEPASESILDTIPENNTLDAQPEETKPEAKPEETKPEGSNPPARKQKDSACISENDAKEKKPRRDSEYNRSKTVCPRLLKQECPHGITGLTGGACEHYHPTWCKRYMRNGPDGSRGCKSGENCRFFHPTLCQNGLVTMMCFNENCKEIHIRGVKRLKDVKAPKKKTKPVDKETNPPKKKATSVPARESKRSSNVTVPPNRTPPISNPPSPKPMDNEDFLKHLAQMKADLTKEVTKDLSALIQSSLQSMMVQQQLRVEPNRQMYPPPPVQFHPPPEFHHPTHRLPAQPFPGYPLQIPPQFLQYQAPRGM